MKRAEVPDARNNKTSGNIARMISIAGFVASFVLAFVAGNAAGGVLSVFVRINCNEVPRGYWAVTWAVSGVLGLFAGIHSFRSTSELYRDSDHGSSMS